MSKLAHNPDEHARGAKHRVAKSKVNAGALPRGRWPVDTALVLDVSGILPVSKGSMRAFTPPGWTRPVITDSGGKELKSYERSIRELALDRMTKAGLPCSIEQPFAIELALYLPRTKGDLDTHGGVRAKARIEPWVKPDVDKLSRAVLDALTGVVFDDDSRVCRIVVEKKYAGPRHDIGLWLRASVRPSTFREQLEWSQQKTITEIQEIANG